MPSLSHIPEPTTAHRTSDETPAPQHAMQTLDTTAQSRPTDSNSKNTVDDQEPQQQIDVMSCLLILLVAGGALRVVLGVFGPIQGINPSHLEHLTEQGRSALTTDPATVFPLPGLIASGLSYIGSPGWLMVALGSLLTLAATPAAYVIGRAATARRAAGILAAALITVHPAVLTASNTLSGTAIAVGLLTIGLALAVHASKRGIGFAIGGGLTLALAGLAAPLCWIPAALAGPFAGHLSLHHGPRRALTYAMTIAVIALGPVVAYRALTMGTTTESLLTEFSNNAFVGSDLPPADRLLITLTDPSLAELGQALHLPVGDAGKLTANTIAIQTQPHPTQDIVADILADAWLLMNAALASLATVSIGVMLIRRRFIETAVIAGPLLALAFAQVTPGEMLRLPMITLLGVLAAGLLANRPVVVVDEEALAERAARKRSKLAEREEKERARQESRAAKDKAKIYAFDKPNKHQQTNPNRPSEASGVEPPTGILTARVSEESSIPSRPI